MASKTKAADAKVSILKGKDAEDKVLEYMKRMNRPFGAVDVAANLKGAVPKAAAQKILVALAERGELVQKTCGKTTFFVANQAKLEDMPAEKLTALETEIKNIDADNKALSAERAALLGAFALIDVSRLKGAPTDGELTVEIEKAGSAIENVRTHLEPLRAGAPMITAEETAQLEAEWTKWRQEWVRRRKTFNTFWALATDAMTPQQATELNEDLGVELDTPEHVSVERGWLGTGASVLGKRRR